MADRSASSPAAASVRGIGPGRHVPALDGLRGLAILLVMVLHQTLLTGRTRVDLAFALVMRNGWCGVDLFFVLSGFLITGILLDSRDRAHYFRNFYARRAVRIFPLSYLVIFVSLVLLPWLATHASGGTIAKKVLGFSEIKGSEIWYWLYLSNYAMAAHRSFQHGILGVSWSLSIEEQFYLLWPAVIWFCGPRTLKRVCVGLILMALALRIALVLGGADPIVPFVLTPARFDGLAIGALLAIVARERRGLAALERASCWSLPVAFALVATIAVIDHQLGFDRIFPGDTGHSEVGRGMMMFGFTLLPVGFAAMLVLAVTGGPKGALHRFFTSPFMRMCGKYSYAMYFFHIPLRAAIRDLVFAPNAPYFHPRIRFPIFLGSELPGQVLFYLISTALTLAAGWLSWNLYEKHFLKLKRYTEYDPGPRPASPAPTA